MMLSNVLSTLVGLLSLLGLIPPHEASPPASEPGAATALTRPGPDAVDIAAQERPLPTVGKVDARRFAGTWYELARLPVRFQDPASVSTAAYAVMPDGNVSVENTSYIGDDVGYSIRGTAEPVDRSRGDRLRVRFGGFLKAIPVSDEGNYWIIELASDYSMTLVGTPDRDYLWLLARDGTDYDVARANSYLERAAELGFDTTRVTIADWQSRTMGE